jgi:hypothetical protein
MPLYALPDPAPEQEPQASEFTLKSKLLCALDALIAKFIIMTPAQRLAIAIFVIHTYAARLADQTPYLAVTSPEKQCAKTRVLELLDLLVARPWLTVTPSEAVAFRRIDAEFPTLLLDEVDAIFNPKSADYHEGLRAILNSGNRTGTTVPRCLGNSGRVELFKVFCPKVLAGIGTLPETISDRSIPIRLKRKLPHEHVERFRRREVEALARPLAEEVEQWVGSLDAEALLAARPQLPEELSDRMQDGCEQLVALADMLGDGEAVRAALVELLAGERADSTESLPLTLLRDIRSLYANWEQVNVSSAVLLDCLHEIGTWASYFGRELTDRDLAALLAHYDIRPMTVWIPARKEALGNTIAGKDERGYKYDHFAEAWQRYLPAEAEEAA